MRIAFERIKD